MDSIRLALFLAVGLGLPASAQSVKPRAPAKETPEKPNCAWEVRVEEDLRYAEYAYHPMAGEAGVWSAPNRSQDLRSCVSREGLRLFPRKARAEADGARWHLQLRTTSLGRTDGAFELVERGTSAQADRAYVDHGCLVCWFENRGDGIRHGWTISGRPAGADPLWIGLALSGDLALRIEEGERSGVLMDARGEVVLRCKGLAAFDATGRKLVARLCTSRAGLLGVEVGDADALYPLTVHLMLTGPYWTAESDQAGAEFGSSVATAGDVNGDGYSDVIIGAHSFDNGEVDEGRAYVYLGSATGLPTTPSWTAESNQVGSRFGISAATAGDVNGDGYSDVIVGAHLFDNGEVDEGRAYVYFGSATGLTTTPDWMVDGDQAEAQFGIAVATAGDVNSDGYSDVIVGAKGFDNGETNEGCAHVYLGSATGLSISPSWTAEGNQMSASFGSVSTAGDVNGDGYSDVIVGAITYGSPARLVDAA